MAVAAAIFLSAASASLAKDGGPPAIDIEKLCRSDIDALRTVFTINEMQATESCVVDERAAREQLVRNWATYPTLAKRQCVQPREYLPGYVEWQACIEMTQEVLDLRKHQAPAASTVGSGASRHPSRAAKADPASRECPVVKSAEDGSIEQVTNC